MISINNLSVEFSAKSLFDNINYVINPRDKIALVGKNGAGKSTMLKIIAGLQKPTSGSVAVPAGISVGYLPQQMVLTDERTLIEETSLAFSHIDKMQAQLDEYNAELAERTDYDSEDYHKLIDRMTALTERLAMESADNNRAEMERTLLGLGFLRTDFDRPTSEFSGGWRMRVELAKLLLTHPDVLLLDEPTNHLDMKTKDILKQAIRDFDGTVIVVSHDRDFLDGLVQKVYEFNNGEVRECLGGIYEFLEKKKMSSLRELEMSESAKSQQSKSKAPTTTKPADTPQPQASPARLSYAEQRERDRALRKASKKVEEAEADVSRRESELEEIEAKIAAGDVATEIFTAHADATKAVENAMSMWELAQTELDELKERYAAG